MIETPREPEIEAIGRIVRRLLLGARLLLLAAGLAACGWAVLLLAGDGSGVPGGSDARIGTAIVWVCVGLPLLLPVDWLFGRGRWWLLVFGAVLWFGPSWMLAEQGGAYILRVFASFVAMAVLAVWRTVFGLTRAS